MFLASLQVVSIDHWPGGITAAQVQLLEAPEAAFARPYHHITLLVGKGRQPKDANLLPGLVEKGEATRYEVSEEVLLTGTIQGME
jgi:hypothetical protein